MEREQSPFVEARFLEVGETSNGVFYPKTGIQVCGLDESEPYKVNIFRTLRLELRNPLDAELSLTLPPGRTVVDTRNMRRAIRSSGTKIIRYNQLRDLLSQCVLADRDVNLVSQKRTPNTSGWRWVFVVLSIMIAGVFAAFYWRWCRVSKKYSEDKDLGDTPSR